VLLNLAQAGKFPSPLMIEGPRAQVLAQKLIQATLCESHQSCGHCPSCKKYSKNFHPDLLMAEGGMKMDELRGLLAKLRQKPFECPYRILWIKDFHDASVQIQNALLKTLEEPLSHWVIVLDLKSSHPILPTIRSRCLLYRDPDQKNVVELDEKEDALFRHIQNKSDWELYPLLENILKTRESASAAFQTILKKASAEQYPEHWEYMGPALLQSLEELDRNLSPKTVWEKAWNQAALEATRKPSLVSEN
jgi:hypothetical protein